MTPENQPTYGESTPGLPDATLRGLDVGQLIAGRFRLVRALGKGGMGVVWLARDESLGEEVAFKFLSEIVAHDEAALHDLKREVRRSRQLTHAHIIRVHDLVEDPARRVAGITMEVAGGGSLATRRARTPHGWFEPHEITEWVRQLCEALDYAHRTARVVHRDLKPANLLVDDEGRLKIADFGIAAALHESATRLTQGKISGTPAYMSPEQWQGYPPTPADDLYALGATLYELLAGKPPFYSGNIAAAVLNLPPISIAQRRHELESVVAPIPPEWEETLAALLAKTAEQRLQSAGEVAAQLGLAPEPWKARSERVSPIPATRPSEAAAPSSLAPLPSPSPPTPPAIATPPPDLDSRIPTAQTLPPSTSPGSSSLEHPLQDHLLAAPKWPWLSWLNCHPWAGVLIWAVGVLLIWQVAANFVAFGDPYYKGNPVARLCGHDPGTIMRLGTWAIGLPLSLLPIFLLRPRWWGIPILVASSAWWIAFLLDALLLITDWYPSNRLAPPRQQYADAWFAMAALYAVAQAAALWRVRTRLWVPAGITSLVLILQSCLGPLGTFHIYLRYYENWSHWLCLQGAGSLVIAAAWFYGTEPID